MVTRAELPRTKTLPAAPDLSDDGAAAELKDVWSRSGAKYRVRAVVLLGVNVVLFAGVGSFAFWLRTGHRFAPVHPGYWDELRQVFLSVGIAGHRGYSLGSLLLEPISAQDVPMQIPILGLLMATLISIPILVAMLYRFWASVPFVIVVGFLAVMPWLAVTVLISCILVSLPPFRPRFRFVSALVGLVPAAIYLVLAWWGTADDLIGTIDPVDRIKFVAPWVLAIVAATVVFALVLSIAKLVDYRPGAIAPLLAVMLGVPVALFEFHVGRDELYYRLLVSLNRFHFSDVDASLPLERAVQEAWERHPSPRPGMDTIREMVETWWQFELASDVAPIGSALTRYQQELAARCDWFMEYFPTSRYALNVLFIKARALDMRVDPVAFRNTKWIRFYSDFPGPASRATWGMIVENSPNTILGAVAALRLAQMDAREGGIGDIDRAIGNLTTVLAQTERPSGEGSALSAGLFAGELRSVLRPESPESSLNIRRERIVLKASRLRDLLTHNNDPLYDYDPVSGSRSPAGSFAFGLLDLDPRHAGYAKGLRALKREYPNCQIADNLDLEMALAKDAPIERISGLEACIRQYPRGDAIPEALFRLGVAYKARGDGARSRRAHRRLFEEYADTIWARQAAQYTTWMGSTLMSDAES